MAIINDLKWRRLSVVFLAKKSSILMKSHPVSVFQAIIKAVSGRTPAFSSLKNEDLPVFHIKDKKHSFKMKPLDQIRVDFFFFKRSVEDITLWRQNLVEYLSDPVYNETVEILTAGEVEERNYSILSKEFGSLPGEDEGEICLEFLSPLPFNIEKGKNRVCISKERFIKLFEKRFSQLFGGNITYECRDDDFTLLPYYWNYTEIKHRAKSQPGNIQYINGTVGKLYIKGTWRNFLPFLIVGSEIHTGSKLANSQGYYRILPEAPPHFADIFPDTKALISIIREVIETYDHAAEWLAQKEMYPFDEKEFAEKLCDELKNDRYEASPNTAFVIRRKDKKDRVVEQMNFKDLIVSRYLVKTVYNVFDNIFEEESIGSRKGISRERSVGMVKSAVDAGYGYIIESDIEEFFPSVELKELWRLLDYYLPTKDGMVKRLLEKLTGNGYIMDGRYHERVKGLALGNPLSSILANLYLDSFDEYVKELDVRFIRYVDDFIIFCKSPEDGEKTVKEFKRIFATEATEDTEGIASASSSAKGPGNLFSRSEVKKDCFFSTILSNSSTENTDVINKLSITTDLSVFIKESLIITGLNVSLGLIGDMIVIKEGQRIVELKAIRRVSEIEIRGDSIVSAGILRCSKERGISLSIRLIGGYILNVIPG